MSALYTTTWMGTQYGFDLDPLDDSPFVGADGGIRDFVWRLSGVTPAGRLILRRNGRCLRRLQRGSPDRSAVRRADAYARWRARRRSDRLGCHGYGDHRDDVPVGRYAVTASYKEPGKPSVDLLVRVRGEGDFARTVTAQFEQVSVTGQQLELEVRSR